MQATLDLPGKGQLAGSGTHLIASIKGPKPGPTLIIIGSIHGNEPAGAIAARNVAPLIQRYQPSMSGEVVLLSGNTRALAQRVRYIDADLNRHWSPDNLGRIKGGREFSPTHSEDLEVAELLDQFELAAQRARGGLYFLDLHTTSAHGDHFATVGDTLRNRTFAMNFPTTIVLGLEEQIEGTMLEYVNNLGAVTMGFEAGQHDAPSSIAHDEAVIWIALVAAGILSEDETPEIADSIALLKSESEGARIVEVRHRHAISPEDEFKMEPDFKNFDPVRRGQVLARDVRGAIKAIESGMVLLPLYQKLGDDGFFLGRRVKPFWLRLSSLVRRLKIGEYVHLFPGVHRQTEDGRSFEVDTRIARILPLQIFHLLGFRKLRWVKHKLVVSRRLFDLYGPETLGLKEIQK